MTGIWGIFALGMLALAAFLGALLLPARAAAARPAAAIDPDRGFRVARRPAASGQAGWDISGRKAQIALMAGLSLGAAVVAFLLLQQPLLALLIGCIAGPAALWVFVGRRRQAYLAGFGHQFLPALDIIVRGMRSGMPLISALEVVRTEIGGPVRIEFQRLLDDMSIGLSLTEAVDRLADRVPLTEVQFFAIVIGVQTRTGGRLSEALENLAGTLRDRRHLELRIRTVSQGARTSAAIIAALPVFVTAGLFLFNPSYISVLFVHPLGIAVFCFCLLWMAVGSLIMRRMTEIHV